MITGKHPFPMCNEFNREIIICKSPPPKLDGPSYSMELCDFVEKWLVQNRLNIRYKHFY